MVRSDDVTIGRQTTGVTPTAYPVCPGDQITVICHIASRSLEKGIMVDILTQNVNRDFLFTVKKGLIAVSTSLVG